MARRALRRFSVDKLDAELERRKLSFDKFTKMVFNQTGVNINASTRGGWKRAGAVPSIDVGEAMAFTLGASRDVITEEVPLRAAS